MRDDEGADKTAAAKPAYRAPAQRDTG